MLGGPPFVRDAAVMAVIFGVAAFIWFGWGQENPPRRWRLWLGVGSGLGLLVAVIGGVLSWQHWGPESALADAEARRLFGIVAGIEFGLAGIGAAFLGLTGRSRWIPVWIAFVVGVHFVPLAHIFADAGLIVLAVAMVVAGVLGVVEYRRSGSTPSAVVGMGSGVALLAFAVRAVVDVLLR